METDSENRVLTLSNMIVKQLERVVEGQESPKEVYTYADYIWLDGSNPQQLRSKIRILNRLNSPKLEDFPVWSFDGSSTGQAKGSDSDCEIRPVYVVRDPLRGQGNYLVLCEVFHLDGRPHETNTRRELYRMMKEQGGDDFEVYIGFEQEYTLVNQKGTPLGFPESGYPSPQGPYYCGVGASKAFGRQIIEEHLRLCVEAGLSIYGINGEVMPGQWEFQIGYRGDKEGADPLSVSDQLWVARYLLERLAENYKVDVSYSNKPVKGDWNGAGMHTNFSTKFMRDSQEGSQAVQKAIETLKARHDIHIQDYGQGLGERLTGVHETCSIDTFTSGVSDRGASVRIPPKTSQKGYGYIEDRRPGANADPYKISICLVGSICGLA